MAFKMKGFTPFHQEVVITDAMRTARNNAEIAFNNQLAEEGFSTDTNLEGASEKLLALKAKLDKLRQPFIEKNEEELKKKKEEGKGLWGKN